MLRFRALILPLVLVLCAALSQAQQAALPDSSASQKSDAKDSVKKVSGDEVGSGVAIATAPHTDLATQPAVMQKMYVNYHFEADGTGTRSEEIAIKVQSEAGVQNLGQLQFGYNSGDQEIAIEYVQVRKPDGSVIKADLATAVQDMTGRVARVAPMYTDYREKHVTVPALQPGDTLEYKVTTITRKPLAQGQFWMEHEFSDVWITLDSRLTIDAPKGKYINLKVQPDFKNYETKETKDRVVYSWKFSNLVTREDRDKFEIEKNGKAKKRPAEEPPSVQLTTFKSWSELGTWYSALEQERRVPSDEMKAKVAELTKDKTSELDKVQAVYDFVAKTYRYVSLSFGIGRYQPHASSEVFKNEYGDCKDKHTLLASMLSVLGYKMNTVLIGSEHKLDTDVPSPSQFDHVIGNLKVGDKAVWMDTTSEIAPIGVLVPVIRGKQALQITSTAVTEVVRTPEGLPFESTVSNELVGKVTELGKLEAHVVRTLRGDQEVSMRSALRRTPQANWEDMLNYYLIRSERINGKATNIKATGLEDTTKPFVLEYDLSVPNFIDWSAKESKLKLPLENYSQLLPSLEDDDPDPAKLYGPVTLSSRVKITLPDSISVTLPVPLSIKREYGSYSDMSSFDNHVLSAERKITLSVFELPQTKARDLTAFTHVIDTDLQQQASLKNSSTAEGAVPPKGAKKEELEEAASNAQAAHKFQLAVDLLLRVVELDPKHPRAWNKLGLCYSAMTQYDKAIDAYKKALEVNAYDEFAYDYMGGAYELQQKYEEAKDAYRKQLEINPLEVYAHLSLGRLLMREHNYKEAVGELEKANGIKPDTPQILQMLGEAYLNTDQVDKAMTAFDKALEKSATPDIWNNIAYVLAKAKQRLDKAQQYSESAVSSTDTLMRNLSGEQSEWEGRTVSANLATYWDTLGWVYFQQGDNDKALKYLLPAWEHSFNGEVGDHLAQVYEKKGKKEKAIELYATALNCPESIPETKDHLAALLGKHPAPAGRKPVELAQKATLKGSAADGTADVLLTFKGDGSIEATKLLGDSKVFEPLLPAIKTLRFGFGFPDTATHGFVHKASIVCKAGSCTVTIAPADPNTLGAAGEAAGGGNEGSGEGSSDGD